MTSWSSTSTASTIQETPSSSNHMSITFNSTPKTSSRNTFTRSMQNWSSRSELLGNLTTQKTHQTPLPKTPFYKPRHYSPKCSNRLYLSFTKRPYTKLISPNPSGIKLITLLLKKNTLLSTSLPSFKPTKKSSSRKILYKISGIPPISGDPTSLFRLVS